MDPESDHGNGPYSNEEPVVGPDSRTVTRPALCACANIVAAEQKNVSKPLFVLISHQILHAVFFFFLLLLLRFLTEVEDYKSKLPPPFGQE